MTDDEFAPRSSTARCGDTIRLRNAGQSPHDAVTTDGAPEDFATALLRPGKSDRVQVRRRGRYRIVCTLHPRMHMTLRVR